MLRWIITQWEKNKGKLEEAIKKDENINSCEYDYLVKLVVRYILNDGCEIEEKEYYSERRWNEKRISVINDGNYQGTLIFVIPMVDYQPSYNDYLVTHQYYGSCSGCDTLQAIQYDYEGMDEPKVPTQSQAADYLLLCQHLVSNMKWLYEEERDDEN